MKFVMGRRKTITILAVFMVLLAIGTAGWVLVRKENLPPYNSTESEGVAVALAEGSCPDGAVSELRTIHDEYELRHEAGQTGLYAEKIAACYVFLDQPEEALWWYERAREAYNRGELSAEAERAGHSLEAITTNLERLRALEEAGGADTELQLDGNE